MPSKIRYCVVNTCINNSRICPTKIFISTKSSWYPIIGRKDLSKNSCFFICEDHFDFKSDAANWLAYSKFSRFLRLKKDVVPHLFLDGPSTVPLDYSQLSPQAKDDRQRWTNFISCRPEYRTVPIGRSAETDPLSIDDAGGRPAHDAGTPPATETVYEAPRAGTMDFAAEPSEDPLRLDATETDSTPYDLLELIYSPRDVGSTEVVGEDVKPDVRALDAQIAADKEGEGSRDGVDAFLKYLGTKLRRIDEERLYDKAETEILGIVQKYINKTRLKRTAASKSKIGPSGAHNEKLRTIKNDHDYGNVLWLTN